MNTKSFLFGVVAGAVAAALLQKPIANSIYKQPETVLHKVKNIFKKEGPISGSWIEMKPHNYTKGPVIYAVYKGGITRDMNEYTEQWEFIADAKTGVIVDLQLTSD